MRVLIICATVEGQTEKVARFVKDQVEQAGHEALIVTAESPGALSFENVGAVVLAAPVHERRHPPAFEALIVALRQELRRRPTLMLSVSLKAAFAEGIEEAGEYLREMEMRTGFEATQFELVPGAVRAGAYGYFETQVLRHVVLEGQEFQPEDGPHEFTDWDRLAAVLADFVDV